MAPKEELALFCQQADQLKKTKLYSTYVRPDGISTKYDVDQSGDKINPAFSKEEFDSFLIIWRRLFIAEDDPATMNRAWNLVARASNSELRKKMKENRKDFDLWLLNRPLKVAFTPTGSTTSIQIDFNKILSAINGGIFHAGDEEERKFLKVIQQPDFSLEPFALTVFLLPAMFLSKKAIQLAEYIEQENLHTEYRVADDLKSNPVGGRASRDMESPFDEVWVDSPDGQALCALINGDRGWLMYLRGEGDSGFSSRNPDYSGPPDAEIEYRLKNGQHDLYPASWALPIEVVRQAIEFFEREHKRPPFVIWHET